MKTTREQRAELRARVPTSPQSMYQLYVRRDELHPLLDDLDEALADLAKERERAEKAERNFFHLKEENDRLLEPLCGKPQVRGPCIRKHEHDGHCYASFEEVIEELRGEQVAHAAHHKDEDALRAELETTKAQLAEAERALAKIDAIRNSIVGRQNVNWSMHIYPLVAALGEAGYGGEGYDVARPKAEAEIKRLVDECEAPLRAELAECRAELEKWRTHNAWLVDNSVKKGQEAEAAEARAERTLRNLDATLRDSSRNLAERCHAAVVAIHNALAETEKEKP